MPPRAQRTHPLAQRDQEGMLLIARILAQRSFGADFRQYSA
jgi:hypothetical protein